MSWIGLLLGVVLMVHLGVSQEYQTFHFKDEMKVQQFSFSENEEYMVILQNYYYSSSRQQVTSLPLCIYKKGENGYSLIGKESYEKVKEYMNDASYSSYLDVIGRIQMNRKGNLFITLHNDNIVRVYQIKNGTTTQIQRIEAKKRYQFKIALLSYSGNFIAISGATNLRVYKWNGTQFLPFYETLPINYYIQFSTQGELLISRVSTKQLGIYKLEGETYLYTKLDISNSISMKSSYEKKYKLL